MTDTLVDTNVLLDIADEGSAWWHWSSRRLAEAGNDGGLVINQVVYAELAAGYAAMEQLDAAFMAARFRREDIPWTAAFLAGTAFLRYRRAGGMRSSPLPDFFIGAHAAVRRYRLLTRDHGYYRRFFPTLVVISPDAER